MMEIRILSAVGVFVSSLFGCLGTFWLSRKQANQYQLLKSIIAMFSAGMMMSLAFVHITSETIIELSKYSSFPVGATCVLAGLVSIAIVDGLSHSLKPSVEPEEDLEKALHSTSDCAQCVHHCNQEDEDGVGHSHTCISTLNTRTLASVATQNHPTHTKSVISLYLFEVACVLHSFIIGLSLGFASHRSKSIKPLSIALCCHQFLEGISLGSLSGDVKSVSRVKAGIIALVYSATAPAGILVGLFLDGSIHFENEAIITSCFQGFAGGMLLYIAMFQILAEEVSKKELSVGRKLMLYAALVFGASSMCVLALYL